MRRSPANVSTVRTLPRVAEHSVGTAALVTGLRCRTGDVACTVDLEPDLARQRDWRGRADPVGLLQWPGRRLFVQHLLDDWIFARRYIHGEDAVLRPRLDRVAERLCEAARAGEADEVLVLGHSLGAVLAIDLLDRALRLEPRLGQDRSAVAFISVGSSIPKIGLHRAAARFRAAVERVANARAIFWGEYQTLTDVMSFYKVDPVTDMGLKGRSPLLRPSTLTPVARFRSRAPRSLATVMALSNSAIAPGTCLTSRAVGVSSMKDCGLSAAISSMPRSLSMA